MTCPHRTHRTTWTRPPSPPRPRRPWPTHKPIQHDTCRANSRWALSQISIKIGHRSIIVLRLIPATQPDSWLGSPSKCRQSLKLSGFSSLCKLKPNRLTVRHDVWHFWPTATLQTYFSLTWQFNSILFGQSGPTRPDPTHGRTRSVHVELWAASLIKPSTRNPSKGEKDEHWHRPT